jgi:uncharacterized protein
VPPIRKRFFTYPSPHQASTMSNHHQTANRLLNESSPYLLQHAYNPVDWYPWGDEALQKAKSEDKPIIVSIGYSACHWCHVMERESFEQVQLADLMNKHFVCIKVDREERPDVDQVYMDAVQAMGLQGGWPLNVFLLPDARPFYGGTYFPPDMWGQVLANVAAGYQNHKLELSESAEKFAEALNMSEVAKFGLTSTNGTFTEEALHAAFAHMSQQFDKKRGGMQKAPKFPMPGMYTLLLRYYHMSGRTEALEHAELTLREMAYGGIYDQLGGGFARYSVDADWFAPHFEKMLYDNAQLLSTYAEAYTLTKNKLYRKVIEETAHFVLRELTDKEGGFYSALDADSEGVEGKFYTWTFAELEQILGNDINLFSAYYNLDEEGNWEEGVNILHRSMPDETFARLHNLSLEELSGRIEHWHTILLTVREQRVRPGLDDKILTSWNGLMLKGLVDAYRALGDEWLLEAALHNAAFLRNKLLHTNRLFHTYKASKATVTGYLEDYAALIQGYIALYQATFQEEWLRLAETLITTTLTHFWDEEEDLFFFTANDAEKLIARKKEFFDNVIPSSNSIMARNLYEAGLLLEKQEWVQLAERMLARVQKLVERDAQFLYNWAILYTQFVKPTAEVAIAGPDSVAFRKALDEYYFPNKLVAGSVGASALPLLQDRGAIDGKTALYVCFNKTCQKPVTSVVEAVGLLKGL